MKQNAESKAWREVARRFAEGEERWGLCKAISDLEGLERGVKCAMQWRVRYHLDGAFWAYPHGAGSVKPQRVHAPARVLAALWLAMEAQEGT